MHEDSQPVPLAYRPATAAAALGISRAQLFRELGSGRLQSCKAGAIRLITREALLVWLRAREAEADDDSGRADR